VGFVLRMLAVISMLAIAVLPVPTAQTFGLPTVTRMGRDPVLRGSVALAAWPVR
jgi:hypothetical protein